MSVNDDAVQSGSDSFWELGRYSRTVKRCDNGHVLCNSLKKLIEERSEIEKKYAADLSKWAKQWNNYLDKGPEYGTCQGAWRGVLTEADHVADLHTIMSEKMMSDVHRSIKEWQKESYHKSMMHFKESKEFEDNFRKAQKPWGKRLSKVMAAKKDYHTACKSEKSTSNQENNARGDTTVSQDALKKLQDKLRKCQQEVEATREKYHASVNDLNGYNAKYIEDMTEVYNRCQDFEQKRIDFFKKTLFSLHSCLDLSVEARYSQIYTSLHTTIGNLDPSKDLKWWSAHHGVDMAMHWPTFEEYSPELQQISKRQKSGNISSSDGIIVTGITHKRDDSYGSYNGPEPSAVQQQQQEYEPPNYNNQVSTDSYGATSNSAVDSRQDSPVNDANNPFGDSDGDDLEQDEETPPSEGWTVRALYDYNKAEDDELSFKQGDIFTQLTREDDMGWCTGSKGGQVGLLPNAYVERI